MARFRALLGPSGVIFSAVKAYHQAVEIKTKGLRRKLRVSLLDPLGGFLGRSTRRDEEGMASHRFQAWHVHELHGHLSDAFPRVAHLQWTAQSKSLDSDSALKHIKTVFKQM